MPLFRIIFSSLMIVLFSANTFAADPTLSLAAAIPSFAASEHILLGNQIKLFFSSDDIGQIAYVFHLPSGLDATYGEVIALGDLYGVEPISHGKDQTEKDQRFLDAFNSFANDPKSVKEAKEILAVMYYEKKMVEDGIARGENPRDVYKKIGPEVGRRMNCATGGGCDPNTWWLTQGRYLILAGKNFDHFQHDAWIAYQTGHNLAIKEALSAHQAADKNRLALAYAMNAFACHFLSDRFSAGHIRTPRWELSQHTTPSTTGNLLAGYMHNEENAAGIHVHNERGDHWVSYGDRSYRNQDNAQNRFLINEILQTSAKQIFIAYQQGIAPVDETKLLLPMADEMENASNQDISPLFYWSADKKKLLRRQDLTNVYDRHWTDNWWGWSTLAELAEQRGTPAVAKKPQLSV